MHIRESTRPCTDADTYESHLVKHNLMAPLGHSISPGFKRATSQLTWQMKTEVARRGEYKDHIRIHRPIQDLPSCWASNRAGQLLSSLQWQTSWGHPDACSPQRSRQSLRQHGSLWDLATPWWHLLFPPWQRGWADKAKRLSPKLTSRNFSKVREKQSLPFLRHPASLQDYR